MKPAIYKIKQKEKNDFWAQNIYMPLCPKKHLDLEDRLKALCNLPKAHITHPRGVKLFNQAKRHIKEFEENANHFWYPEKRHVAFDTVFYQAVLDKFKPFFK